MSRGITKKQLGVLKLSDEIVIDIDVSSIGTVKTVNGIKPDLSGDIKLPLDMDTNSISSFRMKDVAIDGLIYNVFVEGGVMKANANIESISCVGVNTNDVITEDLSVVNIEGE